MDRIKTAIYLLYSFFLGDKGDGHTINVNNVRTAQALRNFRRNRQLNLDTTINEAPKASLTTSDQLNSTETTITRINYTQPKPIENVESKVFTPNLDPINTLRNPSPTKSDNCDKLGSGVDSTEMDHMDHEPSRKRQIKNVDNLKMALEAVRFEGIGFCKAARIHGVNNRTLWLQYHKLGYPPTTARSRKKQVHPITKPK